MKVRYSSWCCHCQKGDTILLFLRNARVVVIASYSATHPLAVFMSKLLEFVCGAFKVRSQDNTLGNLELGWSAILGAFCFNLHYRVP